MNEYVYPIKNNNKLVYIQVLLYLFSTIRIK